MRHLYIRIYAFISMLTIFLVVGIFIFHIIDDTNKEIDNAKIIFNKFEKAIDYEVKSNLLEDETSRQRLRGIARALNIKGFVIQIAPNVGRVFSYPSDSSLFTIVNGNVLVKEHSKFLKVFKTEVYTTTEDTQEKVYITAIISVFPSKMIFIRSRTVFFVALALILLTGLVRILLSIGTTEKVKKVYTSFDKENEVTKHPYNSYQSSGVYESSTPTFEKNIDDSSNTIDELSPYTDLQQDFSPTSVSYNASDAPFSDSVSSGDEFSVALAEEPKGLYSPLTGFGWKGYLKHRLSSEILRATSTDQDISLVIVKIQDIDFSSISLKSISEIILETFEFRDMIFEYSDDVTLGFAVILQDMYIEEAIKICDPLFLKLKNEIYLTGQEPTIGIGITTRACRLADEKIILEEAEEAVSRALKTKTPIVGFKPNAEKYRQQTIEGRD